MKSKAHLMTLKQWGPSSVKDGLEGLQVMSGEQGS
ncbi:hypothetical protein PMI34_05523 [Pseudomonas sp. GM74]|nr:hypothetical protein PMI34_05523 [Pseudomonas sp. GM74]